MDFIKKLFSQHPFIYYIGGKYYAFGNYVCAECDMQNVTLESRYKEYEDSVDKNLSKKEAWKIFHRLTSRAEFVRKKNGYCFEPKKELMKFQLNEEEMKELKLQVERYATYWKKYSFSDFC